MGSSTAWRLPQPYDDDEDDDSSSEHTISDGDKEEEAILRAMERVLSGRTDSSLTFSAEESSTSVEDGALNNSFYDCEELSTSSFPADTDKDDTHPVPKITPPTRSQSGFNQPRRTQKLVFPRRSEGVTSSIDRQVIKQTDSTNKKRSGTSAVVAQKYDHSGLEFVPMPKPYSLGVSTCSATAALGTSRVVLSTPSTGTTKPPVSRAATKKSKSNSPLTTPTISPWVRRFLTKYHKDVLLPVPRDFIVDNFNLVLLPEILSLDNATFRGAWKLLVRTKEYDEESKETDDIIETAATNLYLRLHQRFLLSHRGMDMVRRRLRTSPIFGRCPAPACEGTPLLPIGQDDSQAQRYCVSCRNVWMHWDTMVPGWAWGDSFCHLFVLEHGEEVLVGPSSKVASTSSTTTSLAVPQIFGFQLHPSAKYG